MGIGALFVLAVLLLIVYPKGFLQLGKPLSQLLGFLWKVVTGLLTAMLGFFRAVVKWIVIRLGG